MLFLHVYCGAELSAFQRKKKDVHDLLHFLMFAPRKFSSGNTQFDWVNIWVRVRGTGKINLIKQGKLQPISVFCVGVPLVCYYQSMCHVEQNKQNQAHHPPIQSNHNNRNQFRFLSGTAYHLTGKNSISNSISCEELPKLTQNSDSFWPFTRFCSNC